MGQPSGGGRDAVRPVEQERHDDAKGLSPARRFRSVLRELGIVVAIAVVLSVLVKTFLFQAFFIPSGSMEPTLHGCIGCQRDRVLVEKVSDRISGIHRGDIVVFRDSSGWLAEEAPVSSAPGHIHDVLAFVGLVPSDAEGHLIKRVIGVGGDTVEGRNGTVYVNGTALTEPYVFAGDRPSSTDFKVTVPAGELWVMGDHRDGSSDSRAHQQEAGHGFVPQGDVVGRAFLIVWPLNRVGTLSRPSTFDQPGLANSIR